MAAVNYTAQRSLAPGHSADTAYTLALRLMSPAGMVRSRAPKKQQAVALGGQTETIRHRTDTLWQCRSVPLTGSDLDELREFLDSVDGGEAFTFDPDAATVVTPRTMILEGKGYTEQRVARLDPATGLRDDAAAIAWVMRELP